ncbi:uncharacterized protein FTJAE_2332 [Fusarium tjaetaba]|uniref:Monooxygenase n=1 Tax=Fusarium tjaetaba TaxID=1567544 RepID=A0A8H5W1V3_9HYPO|nr:uncharacterized protein FTJAE_2332 [Fusarium tjaetaba]KAF5645902.1 hypothetical protein FTJAE_2332 [Fusarium tjaetaba]
MPIFVITVPEIPSESQDRFLEAWPTLKEDLKSQPAVAGVSAGPVVAENGAAFTGFKFVQTMAFKTAQDFENFQSSAWAQEHKARYNERVGGEPVAGKFEVPDFPANASAKAFTQFTTVLLDDREKRVELRKAWTDLASALGLETWGGISIGDGPSVGLGMIGWDSLEEAKAAYGDPKAAEAYAQYKALGQIKSTMVKLE